LPFLEQTGLFSFKDHFQEVQKGYYHITFIILFIAFMYLRRIKNPEQLKHHSPGEFGKIMGLDRVPEAKCLRKKLKEIYTQQKSWQWNMNLAKKWSYQEENEFYYIDGHVQVYNGYKAKLGKKHVARQKLCLPGMQEFWVNNKDGMPYFYITGQVNEKLIEMLETQIIPTLLKEMPSKYTQEELENDPELPRFTLVFDREAYSPAFFQRLWDKYRIAIITYRKNVKDVWGKNDFNEFTIDIEGAETKMLLAEKTIKLDNVPMREIRRLSGDHQTSVLTTNKKLSLHTVAIHMFARWTQENFFKYMRQDYDFDRLLQYAVEQIDEDFVVVNPEYNNIAYRLKKTREKISRRMATLYKLQEDNVKDDLDSTNKYLEKQIKVRQELDDFKKQEKQLLDARKQTPYKIKIEDMPDNIKYNKLNLESKRFQNIIKIICYRAETSFANLLSGNYKKSINEKRTLVKSIINSHADIVPDYQNNTLTVKLYSQSSPRMNDAIKNICNLLNQTKTQYPGTDLILNYKIAT
jgi:Transposase protein